MAPGRHYIVLMQISLYGDRLDHFATLHIHQQQSLLLLDLVANDPMEGGHVPPPPPVEIDGEAEYQV